MATADDDDVADLLMVELRSLAGQKHAANAELADLDRRIADAAADTARVKMLTDYRRRVGQNLDRLSYAEKRLALDAECVQVRVYRLGSDEAEREGRWVLTIRPVPSEQPVAYRSMGVAFTGGTRATRAAAPIGQVLSVRSSAHRG
jgi:hypothetical protein